MIEFLNSNFSTVNKIHKNSQVPHQLEEINHLLKNMLRYDNYVKLIILSRICRGMTTMWLKYHGNECNEQHFVRNDISN